jgi:hypothetical protein
LPSPARRRQRSPSGIVASGHPRRDTARRLVCVPSVCQVSLVGLVVDQIFVPIEGSTCASPLYGLFGSRCLKSTTTSLVGRLTRYPATASRVPTLRAGKRHGRLGGAAALGCMNECGDALSFAEQRSDQKLGVSVPVGLPRHALGAGTGPQGPRRILKRSLTKQKVAGAPRSEGRLLGFSPPVSPSNAACATARDAQIQDEPFVSRRTTAVVARGPSVSVRNRINLDVAFSIAQLRLRSNSC